jgi:hypothetical protein
MEHEVRCVALSDYTVDESLGYDEWTATRGEQYACVQGVAKPVAIARGPLALTGDEVVYSEWIWPLESVKLVTFPLDVPLNTTSSPLQGLERLNSNGKRKF